MYFLLPRTGAYSPQSPWFTMRDIFATVQYFTDAEKLCAKYAAPLARQARILRSAEAYHAATLSAHLIRRQQAGSPLPRIGSSLHEKRRYAAHFADSHHIAEAGGGG